MKGIQVYTCISLLRQNFLYVIVADGLEETI